MYKEGMKTHLRIIYITQLKCLKVIFPFKEIKGSQGNSMFSMQILTKKCRETMSNVCVFCIFLSGVVFEMFAFTFHVFSQRNSQKGTSLG